MSYSIEFSPLSLIDLSHLKYIKAHKYEDDVILIIAEGDRQRLLHLFENEVDGETMYGLALGQSITLPEQPFFIGNIATIEVAAVKSATEWDFQSLLLKDNKGFKLRIGRNDASFPEPTFIIIRVTKG